MSIGKAIVSRLTGDTDVAALVGTNVKPQFRAKDDVPAIVYEVSGDDDNGSNPVAAQVRLLLIASSYAQLQDLSNKVRTALNQQWGTWGGVLVQGVFLEDESEDSLTVGTSSVRYEVNEQLYQCWFNR
jgi:hypothetical protein